MIKRAVIGSIYIVMSMTMTLSSMKLISMVNAW